MTDIRVVRDDGTEPSLWGKIVFGAVFVAGLLGAMATGLLLLAAVLGLFVRIVRWVAGV